MTLYSKEKVVDYIWQYSKYQGHLLQECIAISKQNHGHASLIFLYNLLEMTMKNRLKNHDIAFIDVIKQVHALSLITNKEFEFLNNSKNGVRKIRNLLAHANLSKYNIIFAHENNELLYPLTENETCTKLFNDTSNIIYNLILKIISSEFIEPLKIDIDNNINVIQLKIIEISSEKLLEYKGINYREVNDWDNLSETDRYRLAENASDVNILTAIFDQLLNNDKD